MVPDPNDEVSDSTLSPQQILGSSKSSSDQPSQNPTVTKNMPVDDDSSSSDLRVCFRGNIDYVIPPNPTSLSEGEHEPVASNKSSSSILTPTLDHEGVSSLPTSKSKGENVQSTEHLRMPEFSNPDTIGLRRSTRTPKPRTLTSLFLLFGLMTVTPFVSTVSAAASSAYSTMAYVSDLTKNPDGTINHLNPITQAFNSVQDNDTYTYKQAMEQPDYFEFVKAMKKEIDDHHDQQHWKIVKRVDFGNPRTILAIWLFKRK